MKKDPVGRSGLGSSPVNVVLSVCREVIVNDQGNLLDIDSTSLKAVQNLSYIPVPQNSSVGIVLLVNK